MPERKYLDVSTANVTSAEMDALVEHHGYVQHNGLPRLGDCLPRVICHDYGVWLNVPAAELDDEPTADLQRRRFFPNVQALIERARALDCDWINLDRDAEHEPDLPAFDW